MPALRPWPGSSGQRRHRWYATRVAEQILPSCCCEVEVPSNATFNDVRQWTLPALHTRDGLPADADGVGGLLLGQTLRFTEFT